MGIYALDLLFFAELNSQGSQMLKKDVFTHLNDHYHRDLDIIRDYKRDSAAYLSIQTGRPYPECYAWIERQIKEKRYPIHDPKLAYLERDQNGDRSVKETTVMGYIHRTIVEDEIMAPTFTTYVQHNKKLSVHAEYIEVNKQLRSEFKHAMFEAKMRGDMVEAETNNSRQSVQKVKNNGLSGSFVSNHNTNFNPTGHSTLTSMTRCITSYGNAANERFIAANRHYDSPESVRENIVSVLTHSNKKAILAVMEKYQLRPPTVGEVMRVIRDATRYYWRDETEMASIEGFVRNLNDYQRAAYLYTGDLKSLGDTNPMFVKEFLEALSRRSTKVLDMETSKAVMKGLSDNLTAHTAILCRDDLAGRSMSVTRDNDPDAYGRIAGTALNIIELLNQYEDLIQAFWITKNIPANVSRIAAMRRMVVITSDTDSTIFTVMRWMRWYAEQRGTIGGLEICSTMVLLTSENVRNVLACMSGNMGIRGNYVKLLAMKNEFFFPTFCATGRKKHYFCLSSVQEGNVFKEMLKDFKGVALRNSNIPAHITKDAQGRMTALMHQVNAGEPLSRYAQLAYIANREREIYSQLEKGSPEYLARGRINAKESYKDSENSAYLHYTMWTEVFAPKYGTIEPPPYRAVKISAEYNTPSQFQEFLDQLEDRELAERFKQWCTRNRKRIVKTFMLAESYVTAYGIPKEIMEAANMRQLVAQLTETYYLSLESIGHYSLDKRRLRMANEYMPS